MPESGTPTEFPACLFVCPLCKRNLVDHTDKFHCQACEKDFLKSGNGVINFMPDGFGSADSDWQDRQKEMEDWYRELADTPTGAINCYQHDYKPFADYLAKLSGIVLDVGGGIGIACNYLSGDTDYLNIEPSIKWQQIDFGFLTGKFKMPQSADQIIRGVGEFLPISDRSIDNILLFWVLNHAANPYEVVMESIRCLKPGGKALLVLEDAIPSWSDIFDSEFPLDLFSRHYLGLAPASSTLNERIRLAGRKLSLGPWPLQSDHIRVSESKISRVVGDETTLTMRAWFKHYLVLEFTKKV